MNTAKTFFPQFAADVKETFSLPKFYENFDLESGVINPEILNDLNNKIESFKIQIASLKSE